MVLTLLTIAATLALEPVPGAPENQSAELVRTAIAQVSPARAHAAVVRLAAFGTRHSLSSDPDAARGFRAASAWVKAELDAIGQGSRGRLIAELESFDVPPSARIPKGATLTNVVARLRGVDPVAGERVVYLVAHLDSRNADAMDAAGDAPGANDDASGCAVLLECARALAVLPLRSTIVFLFTCGEEQGLIGARQHVDQAVGANSRVIAVLNNDIVGDPVSVDPGRSLVRVFSEGIPRNPPAERLAQIRANSEECDSASRQLARFVVDVGEMYGLTVRPKLVFRPDRFLRGGDHLPFLEAGFAAVRFTTLSEAYDRQHQNISAKEGKPYGDVPEFVDAEYLGGVARLNAASAIHLAMAPGAPENVRVVASQLTNDTTIRWGQAPDASGYEIVHRDTTAARWERVIDVGNTTEQTVALSKDDRFFGVRSYGRDGWRSPVIFARAAAE